MSGKIKKICAILAACAVTAAMGTVFAESETNADYSFRKGKAGHFGDGGEQTFVYSNEERENTDRNGTGKRHFDSEALVEAGIIDQATADAISEYASQKHETISAMHSAAADMTPEERHSAFNERKASRKDGLEELAEAGIITEEQKEAIENYTPEE